MIYILLAKYLLREVKNGLHGFLETTTAPFDGDFVALLVPKSLLLHLGHLCKPRVHNGSGLYRGHHLHQQSHMTTIQGRSITLKDPHEESLGMLIKVLLPLNTLPARPGHFCWCQFLEGYHGARPRAHPHLASKSYK